MKKTILALLLFATPAFAGEYVKGHWKDTDHDGVKETYIQPYMRSAPDNNPYNNYSTKDNFNPYTGKEGTVNPYNYTQPVNPYTAPDRRSTYR